MKGLATPMGLAIILSFGVAAAAITVVYTNASTLTTSVAPPPIQFLAGDDAGPASLSDYVTSYAISTNATHFTSTVRGVPEATVVIDSYAKLRNVDDASRAVTLSTTNVTNSLVSAYTLQVYDAGGQLAGTLDLRAPTETVAALVTIPAGETWSVKLTLTLGSGAGAHNVAVSNSLGLSVT